MSLSTVEKSRRPRRPAINTDGFDIEGVTTSSGKCFLRSMDCTRADCHVCANLYAKIGLHRYNLYNGTNFELFGIKKFNKTCRLPASFFLTLDACDPSSSGSTSMTFQVRVDEQCIYDLELKCTIARPQVTTKTPAVERRKSFLDMADHAVDLFYSAQWFRVAIQSLLYLQLAIRTKNRTITQDDLSHLEIVKAVMETKKAMEPPNERLKAMCAIVYIRFKNLVRTRSGGEPETCIAIFSRLFNKVSGAFSLCGAFWSEEDKASNTNPKKGYAIDEPKHPTKTMHTETDERQNVHNDQVAIRRHSTRRGRPIQRLLS